MPIICHYTILKREIDELDFTRFDHLFGEWPHCSGKPLQCKYDSLLISVAGYDDCQEEIYTIPAIRRYFRQMHERWPWFLYFFHLDEESIAIPYLCLMDNVSAYHEAGSNRTAAIFDPVELLPLLEMDFPRMNHLFERAGLSDEENLRRSKEIFRTFIPNFSRS